MIEQTSGEIRSLLPKTAQAPAMEAAGKKTSQDTSQQNQSFATVFAKAGPEDDQGHAPSVSDELTDTPAWPEAATDDTGEGEVQFDQAEFDAEQSDFAQNRDPVQNLDQSRATSQNAQGDALDRAKAQPEPNGPKTMPRSDAEQIDDMSSSSNHRLPSSGPAAPQSPDHNGQTPPFDKTGASAGGTTLQDQGKTIFSVTANAPNRRNGEERPVDLALRSNSSSELTDPARMSSREGLPPPVLNTYSNEVSNTAMDSQDTSFGLPNAAAPIGEFAEFSTQGVRKDAVDTGNDTSVMRPKVAEHGANEIAAKHHRSHDADIVSTQYRGDGAADGLGASAESASGTNEQVKPTTSFAQALPVGSPPAQEKPVVPFAAPGPLPDVLQSENLSQSLARVSAGDEDALASAGSAQPSTPRPADAAQNLSPPKAALSPSVQAFALANLHDVSVQDRASVADAEDTRLWSHLSASGPLDTTTGPRYASHPFFNSPDAPRQVVQQLVGWFKAGPDQSSEIFLNPAELGRVRMNLQTAETGVVINIMADRPETLDLLRRNADLLTKEFEAIGYGSAEFNFGQGEHAMQRQPPDQAQAIVSEMPPGEDAVPQITEPVQNPRRALTSDRVDIRL